MRNLKMDEEICINVSKIEYLKIHSCYGEQGIYGLSASLKDNAIRIAKSPDIGILKDKIRTIIAGD